MVDGDATAVMRRMARFLSREPTPEAATQFAEAYERLFPGSADPTLKSIALRKLEGRTSEEIADRARRPRGGPSTASSG